MFSPNMFMGQALCFFRRIGEHALTFVREGQIDRGGDFLADGRVSFDLLPNGLNRRMRAQEPVGERLVFTQQTKQQVLRFNIRRAKLACFIPRKEDDAPGLFCITFEHVPP